MPVTCMSLLHLQKKKTPCGMDDIPLCRRVLVRTKELTFARRKRASNISEERCQTEDCHIPLPKTVPTISIEHRLLELDWTIEEGRDSGIWLVRFLLHWNEAMRGTSCSFQRHPNKLDFLIFAGFITCLKAGEKYFIMRAVWGTIHMHGAI